ncbi:hypothetical protein [Novosphingobium sp. 18052]|nr:hypothetical protein [Novosphingobium sp. 18052]
MHQTLLTAKQQGVSCPTLEALVKAIWLHLAGQAIEEPDGVVQGPEI